MTTSTINLVDGQGLVQDFWSPMFDKELRENNLWTGLLQDPNYTLQRVAGGDTVKITRINKPSSTIKTIGTDADTFTSNIIDTTQVDLKVNKRCVSSYRFDEMAILQSQLQDQNSEMREALLADVRSQANTWIKSLISPSASAPDHLGISMGGDCNLAGISTVRTLAATANWGSSGQPWMMLLDPTFMSDALNDTTMGSAVEMGINSSPMLEGYFNFKRLGFTIVEDSTLATDTGFAFLPSFMKIIIGEPRFKISDLHALGQFGYVISVDFPLGAVQLDDTKVISMIV